MNNGSEWRRLVLADTWSDLNRAPAALDKHGELIALHPDSTPSWKRTVSHGGIYASPVLGANGFIYVVSVDIVKDSYGTHSYSYLHKFDTGGAYFSWVSLPLQNAALPAWAQIR
jgi:hypothetical protein